MATFKIVLNDPKTGKSVQREVKDDDARPLLGKKIGDTIKGEAINLPGFEFKISGGSDASGFPMRQDLPGTLRKKILGVFGVGMRKVEKGIKQRKSIAGNTIHEKTAQLNLVITTMGKEDLFKAAEKPKEEEKKA
ncbi:MAG: 30S ribosomal protein S6e [Nanoarchaeota archaeon]